MSENTKDSCSCGPVQKGSIEDDQQSDLVIILNNLMFGMVGMSITGCMFYIDNIVPPFEFILFSFIIVVVTGIAHHLLINKKGGDDK